jgi:Zn-dependent protease with chaperone function
VSAAGADPRIIARLESEASRNPRAYRLRLALIAIGGDLALTITQLAPWAAPIVIGALWVNVRTFWLLAAVAVAFLAWMLRPSWRFEGRELKREEAPQLQAEIDRLKEKLRVPGRMRVFVDASFNASAAETRGLFGVFGTQCALTLGVPLLLALSREQVLAVIAHEFGHFSRRHGRLGQWLYRARVGWLHYAQSVTDSDSAFDRAAAWYARKFVPFFSSRSFVHSRQCEYEADADAASAVGSGAFAAALSRTAVIARLWTERMPQQIAVWQRESEQAPADFYERFARAVRDCPPGEARAWLDEALRQASGWRDTHPSLSERLGALKEQPRLEDAADSAGSALLGETWPPLLEEFNRSWAAEAQPDWLLQHVRLQRLVRPAPTLAELRELHAAQPDDKHRKFAYAAALLDEDGEAGVALMETLSRAAPAFRAQAFRHVLAYYERRGDARQVERWTAWLAQAVRNLRRAIAEALEEIDAGRARPSSLTGAGRAVAAEAARLDACVRDAWLLEAGAQLHFAAEKAPVAIVVHLLVLAVDPEEAQRAAQDEDRIAERYEDLLRSLLPADQVAVVRTYYTTEMMPALYTPAFSLRRPAAAAEVQTMPQAAA